MPPEVSVNRTFLNKFLLSHAAHQRKAEEQKDLMCFVHNQGDKFRGEMWPIVLV